MRINKRGGLTLVEVVVAIGLFGVIMVTLFPAFLLTNLINRTTKEYTDANALVQNEVEYLYFKSSTPLALTETLNDLEMSRTYDCTSVLGACSKTVNGISYHIYYQANTPEPNVVTFRVTVDTTGGETPGQRSEMLVLLRMAP